MSPDGSTTIAETAKPAALGTREDRPGLAALLMIWALSQLSLQDGLVKIISSDVSLWQYQLLRSACNLTLLVVIGWFIFRQAPTRPKRLWAVALRSVCMVACMMLYFGGAPFLSLAQMAAGLYMFPLFVGILSAVFLGENVGPRRVIAILAGFTGTMLIIKPGSEGFELLSLLPVGAAVFYAITILCTRKLCRDESSITLGYGVGVSFMIAGSIGLGVINYLPPGQWTVDWPFLFTGWHDLTWPVFGIIVAASCLNVTANIGLAKAYQSAESSWLAPFDYSYLVFATFWGFAIWGTIPDRWSILGMAMIAASGTFVAWRERRLKHLPRVNQNRVLR